MVLQPNSFLDPGLQIKSYNQTAFWTPIFLKPKKIWRSKITQIWGQKISIAASKQVLTVGYFLFLNLTSNFETWRNKITQICQFGTKNIHCCIKTSVDNRVFFVPKLDFDIKFRDKKYPNVVQSDGLSLWHILAHFALRNKLWTKFVSKLKRFPHPQAPQNQKKYL